MSDSVKTYQTAQFDISQCVTLDEIEKDPEKCKELAAMITNAIEESSFGGTRESFYSGFGIVVRLATPKDEIRLCFYSNAIEFQNGNDAVINKTKDSRVYDALLDMTE